MAPVYGRSAVVLLADVSLERYRIGEYDHMFDRYELVERPNDHTSVRWTCYRAIWPTRPRDFIIRTTWEEFADGTIVIATKSVENDDFPETPTFVRGRMVSRSAIGFSPMHMSE